MIKTIYVNASYPEGMPKKEVNKLKRALKSAGFESDSKADEYNDSHKKYYLYYFKDVEV